MEPEKPGVPDNWNDVKKELISGLSGSKSTVVKTLLANQEKFLREMEAAEAAKVRVAPMTEEEEADEIIRRLKTPPPKPLDNLRNIILPLIKRVTPGIIANEIIGVQPMTGPVSDIKTLKVRYCDSGKEDSADKGRGS